MSPYRISDHLTEVKTIFCFLLITATLGAFSQIDSVPPYKQSPILPAIHLVRTDSTLLTNDSLSRDRSIIVMFFSPTCHHCQQQISELIKQSDRLQNYLFVLASYQPLTELKQFVSDYQLNNHPNMMVGRDVRFSLPSFYRIRNLPYLALYDKDRKLVTTFEGNVTVDSLLSAFERK